LGDSEGVKVISDTSSIASPEIRYGASFQGANLNRIKRLLAEQICELTAAVPLSATR